MSSSRKRSGREPVGHARASLAAHARSRGPSIGPSEGAGAIGSGTGGADAFGSVAPGMTVMNEAGI